MSQPQPEETAPAGRATPAGPPPAEGSVTPAPGDQPAPAADQQDDRTADQQHDRPGDQQDSRAADQQDGRATDQQDGRAADQQDGRATEQEGSRAGEPDDTAVDVPVGDVDVPVGPDGSATERPGSEESPAVDDDAPTRRTPPPDATRVEQPEARQPGQPVDTTRVDRPAEADSAADGGADAAEDGSVTAQGGSEAAQGGAPASPSEDGGAAPTRVATPRWTGSAAVPPPRPRKRRWFRGDAEEGDDPAAPTVRTRPADPTLRMPGVEADEDDIPTPVDPWAGAADDPWAAYPPVAGHPAASQPPVGYDPPVSPPPARQLPVTRRFPAPADPPPPPAPRAAPAPQAAAPPPPPPPLSSPPPPPQAARPPAAPAPAPRKPPPPPPAAPPRPAKQRRRPEAPPVRKAPPAPAPLPPVRRRRRWPRVMFTMTLLTIVCCCGIPAYYLKPIWDQYPASPADPLPSQVLDLRLLDDGADRRTAEQLKEEVQARNWFRGGKAFAGVYRASNGKRVVIFGSTGFQFSPESAVQEEVTRLQEEYGVTSVESVPTGVRGEYRSCGTGEVDGDDVVVCTSADHGSLATALFTRLSIADSAELLSTLRDSIIVREPVGSGNGSASTR